MPNIPLLPTVKKLRFLPSSELARMATESFSEQGFAVVRGLLSPAECEELARNIGSASDGAGTRSLLSQHWCQALAKRLRAHPGLSVLLPAGYVASQCTYFMKSVSRNWLVPIHQDLSIPVAERVDEPSLSGWSHKETSLFVQAPVELLERLVAIRLHLDACAESDGPLQVIPGSHLQGRVQPEVAAFARRSQTAHACTVDRGDALVMRPLLLHASSKASGSSMRRVLHFLFGPPALPFGLRWQHAV